jgi:hypothetical protein
MHVISANHREVEWPSCRHRTNSVLAILRKRPSSLVESKSFDGTGIPTTSMFPVRVKKVTYTRRRYSFYQPALLVDPSGLTVTCYYNQVSGRLTCTDDSTGQQVANTRGYPYIQQHVSIRQVDLRQERGISRVFVQALQQGFTFVSSRPPSRWA